VSENKPREWTMAESILHFQNGVGAVGPMIKVREVTQEAQPSALDRIEPYKEGDVQTANGLTTCTLRFKPAPPESPQSAVAEVSEEEIEQAADQFDNQISKDDPADGFTDTFSFRAGAKWAFARSKQLHLSQLTASSESPQGSSSGKSKSAATDSAISALDALLQLPDNELKTLADSHFETGIGRLIVDSLPHLARPFTAESETGELPDCFGRKDARDILERSQMQDRIAELEAEEKKMLARLHRQSGIMADKDKRIAKLEVKEKKMLAKILRKSRVMFEKDKRIDELEAENDDPKAKLSGV